MMKIKEFKNSDDAVVGIIVAVLLIGLMLAVVSIFQTVFIPNWMEQLEADHMDEVADQFAQLKFVIGLQSVLKERNLPISTPITLGNKELPILQSAKAFGSIEIIPSDFGVSITNNNQSYLHIVGVIKYSSSNSYFLNQDFIYETGAIIISQDEGNMMSISPTISVINETDFNITLRIVNIQDIGDKSSASGYGTYPIRIEFYDSNTTMIKNVNEIIFTTSYPTSWENYLNSVVGSSYVTSDSNSVTLDFDSMAKTVNVNLTKIDIQAQVAPGWIEE